MSRYFTYVVVNGDEREIAQDSNRNTANTHAFTLSKYVNDDVEKIIVRDANVHYGAKIVELVRGQNVPWYDIFD